MVFLLTHPVWDVTSEIQIQKLLSEISTHTSRVGCDGHGLHLYYLFEISTHTSRVGCDLSDADCDRLARISTHTSRVGCDRYI